MTRPAAPCPAERVLSMRQAAERLGCTVEAVFAMLMAGKLEGRVVRGKQRCTFDSVLRLSTEHDSL